MSIQPFHYIYCCYVVVEMLSLTRISNKMPDHMNMVSLVLKYNVA